MKVMYNCTGETRKALVKATGEVLGMRPRYLGMPSAAYDIGGYEIDREGTLIAPPGTEMDAFERLLGQLYMKGFLYEARANDAQEDIAPVDDENQAQPAEQKAPEPDSEQASSTYEPDRFTIELPLGELTDAQLLNLEKLVASKGTLIKKALGASELAIIKTEDKLAFPWFDSIPDHECISAYARFIGRLYATAKRQKRVLGTERPVDSEKFAFRIFLLRLGLGGTEYAADRKLLLRNLSGSAAFPDDAKAREHAERWKEKRQQRRAGQRSNQAAPQEATSTAEPTSETSIGGPALSNHPEKEGADDSI